MIFIVTAKTVRFMDNGKVKRVPRAKLPASHPLAAKKPPLKHCHRWGEMAADEAEALMIEGGQK